VLDQFEGAQEKEWYWELVGGCYYPNTGDFKNFRPSTGLFHHFYHRCIQRSDPPTVAERYAPLCLGTCLTGGV
jgi:hypothetical protein